MSVHPTKLFTIKRLDNVDHEILFRTEKDLKALELWKVGSGNVAEKSNLFSREVSLVFS